MANSPTFVQHALDLLNAVRPVTARAMFGGHGLYAGDAMLGLLDDDELFLKTDAETVAAFVDAGCRRWTYVAKNVRMEQTSYFRPPDEAHEDPEAMLPWARLALEAALRARRRRPKKAKVSRAAKRGRGSAAGRRGPGRKAR